MSTHAPALAQEPAATLAGVWGRDPAKTRDVAAAFGTRAFASYEALLGDVDAVAFAVPPDVQAELAPRAAAVGAHLLLEKPAALTPGAARTIQGAVSAAGVACLTFFTLRFDALQRAWLDDAVTNGAWLGGWAHWSSSAMRPGGPASGSPWRTRKGALWDVGPHALSVLVPVLGPVEAVHARSGAGDLTHLVVRHRSGASSTLSLTLTAPPERSRVEVGFWGEDGITRMPASDIPYARSYASAVRALAVLARGERRHHPCDLRLSLHVVDALYAAETALGRR